MGELVRAVSEDSDIEGFRQRKRALREQVREAGEDAALLFAADKIAKVRELRERVVRRRSAEGRGGLRTEAERLRLEHYGDSLAMVRDVIPGHALVLRLATELARCRRDIRSTGARSRKRVEPHLV